ncbi:DNA topoisomerase (ATP-hydrolyzing) subunit B [Intestinimonas butyriciproducens]|uniref:DNA gyrase subunit B n=1 Tax=Intestinimonas butyriciproducens TaxID=1297617 RepID=A0A2U1CGQ5_9FIRM|nr:DNA topoisomerase (ATP-hydrolyzing) subunit B [Intestinimonas butyriciproducens]MBU5228915.1 DNA topoisomerase (ATP-hydrolyzing) subunit B [Intestinimonas butyriciproducens]MCR1904448.1 DNA topoisomerase (ATP-hydrolyzing) subunit B [Intestinimonas butyriciproducens]MDB7830435.1 DNA topoisomerase (ATP-hydrolyzing) subunit B [Intestinimonas butyriciproducens]MDB7861271.1 DNA topoisomerase (ATP-hydrolyzing) subunit B [Intestinimonas butyriciproducens]MDB7864123.1 DNA topoisomerase (ATP-hydroly
MSEELENSEISQPEQVSHEYGGSEIQVLEGLEAVRKRPGMYIGSTSSSGLHHLVYEIVDNAIDEALAGYCDEINVIIKEGNVITVTDNGRGIPVDIQPQTGLPALEVVFTILHAGGKFGGGGYKVSGGLHGVGASVVNALSEWLEVQVYKDGKIYEMKFARGKVTQPITVVGDTDKHGTVVTFQPDPEMFTDTTVYDYDILHTRMREEAFLNAGLRIHTIDQRAGREQHDDMCYAGGIREFVTWLNRAKNPIHDGVIYMAGQKGDSIAELAFQYTDSYSESILSFANNVHTPEGGMHETGFKQALTSTLNAYGKRMNLLKDGDEIKGEDYREGLTCIISVKLTDAQFEGQTKAKLGNSEVRTLVSAIVSEKLEEFLEENPAVGRAILDKALTASRAREAARKARESIRRKTALGGAAMPDKLRDCNEVNPELTELYIVEGDSAGGSATQGRDSRFQAILPLWGKMLNVEKARADKVYGNDKLQPVITALGAGIGDEFDPNKLRYHKVIIMADADVDGAHIRTLLLTFFFRFMRPLIEQGYVYAAVPPLYKLTRGKLTRVAFSDEERDKVSAELRGDNPNAKVDISRYKGLGEMDPHELWETTMDPEKRTLKRIELDDAVRADETFTVLMGEKVEPRKEFIEKNARYAVNLDY